MRTGEATSSDSRLLPLPRNTPRAVPAKSCPRALDTMVLTYAPASPAASSCRRHRFGRFCRTCPARDREPTDKAGRTAEAARIFPGRWSGRSRRRGQPRKYPRPTGPGDGTQAGRSGRRQVGAHGHLRIRAPRSLRAYMPHVARATPKSHSPLNIIRRITMPRHLKDSPPPKSGR